MSLIPNRAILEIQEGRSGANPWRAFALIGDISTYRMGALDSTEIEITRIVGRDEARGGKLRVINSYRSGGVVTYSAELEMADAKQRAVAETLDGINNFRLRYFMGEYDDRVNYQRIRLLTGCWNKKPGGGFSRDMVNSTDGYEAPADAQRRVYPLEIDNREEIDPQLRMRVAPTATTLAINDVISFGRPRRVGEVIGENTNNPGNKEYIAVTAKDGSDLPHLLYTRDRWTTPVDVTLTGMTNGDAVSVTKAGSNIVVAMTGTGGGICYAPLRDILAGTATWVRSTNISAGTVVNAVHAVTSTLVLACGPSGAVYRSDDGGRTFTALAAVTANALTVIRSAGPDLIWFGGSSGTLVRMYKEMMAVVTVSGLAVAINDLLVPDPLNREGQLFIADAGGKIRKTLNGIVTAPSFSTAWDAGSGSVDALAGAGYDTPYIYFAHTNGSSQSKLFRDHSGGYFGDDVEALGSYTDPANATINALVAADVNTVVGVGDVQGGNGYIEVAA